MAVDFGDAPDMAIGTGPGNYNTLSTDNGPQHTIVVGLRMGANVDGDGGALQNSAANADDVNGALPDDEDGLINPAADLVLTVGAQPTINVRVTNTTGATATLYGWIDYNANGVFDNATERASVVVPNGTNNLIKTLTFPTVPTGLTGTTYARFRLSSDLAAANPTGAASDGEVEDYRVNITKPSSGIVDSTKTQKIASGTSGGPTLANSDYFGRAVAAIGDIDGDGVTDLAVGANGDDTEGSSRGAVHVLLMNANGTVKSKQKIASNNSGNIANGDYFGSSLASLGDLDGDGVPDLAVGAERNDINGTNRGALHFLFLNSDGTRKSSNLTVVGDANGDYFGRAVASIGDLDGDGVTDVAVGAYGDDTGGADRGSVRILFLNTNGSVKSTQKIASGVGGGPTLSNGDKFGSSITSMGDLDGDGVTDLAVGAVGDDTGGADRGAIQILFLNSNGTVKAAQKIASEVDNSATGLIGTATLSRNPTGTPPELFATDTGLNTAPNDQWVSYILGVSTDVGVITGVDANISGTLMQRWNITEGDEGPVIAPTPNITGTTNGDSHLLASAGALVGAALTENNNINNAAQAFPADTATRDYGVGSSLTGAWGIPAIEQAAQVNFAYIVVPKSAWAAGKITGLALAVQLGLPGGAFDTLTESDFSFPGPHSLRLADGDQFGRSLASVGDLDGDGVTDLAVGAYYDDTGGNARGAVHVLFLNSDGTVKSSQKIASGSAGGPALTNDDRFGVSITSPGDLDGDGLPDLFVGANFDDTGGLNRGSVYSLFLKPVNSTPVITSPSTVNVAENITAVMNVTATDADLPAQALTYSIVGGADLAKFAITSGGALSFTAPPNFEAPTDTNSNNVYEVTVQVSDGNGGLATQAISVSVTPVNDNNPVFSSATTANVSENTTAVATITATDSDMPAQAITFSLFGGADQSKFSLTSGGVLTFASAPDYEMPTDANGDNVYVVIVQASDGAGGTAMQTINVTITPVNDNIPIFTSPSTANRPENTTHVMTVTAIDADLPTQTLTFSLFGGADQSKFSITSEGILTFTSPPNFQVPTDANGDNVYVVVVQASDGNGGISTQTINVAVTSATDFGDAPDSFTSTGPGNYNTRYADNGPRHSIVAGLKLGATVDPDGGALQNSAANADDVNGALPDDEDGLINPAADLVLTVGAQPTINVRVTNTTGATATLYGWIDYNGNGVFDNATERASVAVPNGTNNLIKTLTFPTVPTGLTGTTYARFRLSSDLAAANPTGAANDGEVEDYLVTITNPSSGLADSTKTKKIANDTNGGPTLTNGSYFGNSSASIGDLDGDGVSDMAIGSIGDDTGGTNRGAVFVMFMNANGTVKSRQKIASGFGGGPTMTDGSWFGRSIASLGDLDGDGVSELAVGSDLDDTGGMDRGAVYVLFMNPNGTAKGSQKIANGIGGGPTLANSDRFGISVASIGDLDGDGIADLAVGADGDDTGGSERGATYVLFLNVNGTVKSQQKIANNTGGGPSLANSDRLGRSITSLGDLDGDGITDVAVGAALDDSGGVDRGAVHVLFLNSAGTVKASQKIASGVGGGPLLANGDVFGNSITSLGDLDGDGIADLAVGAFYDDAGGTNAGAVHLLFLNADGTVKNSRKIASGIGGGPTFAGDTSFGSSLAALGDLDGDGLTELAVGAERDDTSGTNRGAVQVLFLKKFNHDPVITSSNAVIRAENTTTVLTVAATDVDLPAQTLTFSITGGADQAKFGITSGGVLSFSSAPDFELPNDDNHDNVYVVSVQVDDGEGGISTQTINVTVAPVNDNSPVFTSLDSAILPENTTAVTTVTATDADLPSQTVTFSIVGGADQAKFAITSGGVLSFKSAPDYEAPTDSNGDNVYVLIVQASDGGLTSLQAILVSVTPANDNPPMYTSPAAVNVNENVNSVLTVTAADSDLPSQTLTFSVVGGADQNKFAITSGGILTFNSLPNFELPTDANGDNVYVVTVLASDGNGLTSSQTVNVTIKDVFEGDYNSDGIVDAADYTVWRDKLGMTVLAFSNPDGSGNGLVDQADYDVWKSNFGNTQPMGSGASEIAPSDPSPTFELPSLAKLETSAAAQSVESVSDAVPVAFTPSIFIVQRDRSRVAYLRRDARDVPAIAASRDRGLVAWLAARPTAPQHDWRAASCQEFPGVLEAGDSSNQFVKKLDQAFSLLWA